MTLDANCAEAVREAPRRAAETDQRTVSFMEFRSGFRHPELGARKPWLSGETSAFGRESGHKKCLHPPAGKNEGERRRNGTATGGPSGPVLLFGGEADRGRPGAGRDPDERERIRYPDSGPQTSLPPSQNVSVPVAMGACSPIQWRNRPRFPRGSLLRSRWERRTVPAIDSKSGAGIGPRPKIGKETVRGDGVLNPQA